MHHLVNEDIAEYVVGVLANSACVIIDVVRIEVHCRCQAFKPQEFSGIQAKQGSHIGIPYLLKLALGPSTPVINVPFNLIHDFLTVGVFLVGIYLLADCIYILFQSLDKGASVRYNN